MLYVIIITQLVALLALLYDRNTMVKQSYQEGFEKGLAMNVHRVSTGNNLEVVDRYGKIYK